MTLKMNRGLLVLLLWALSLPLWAQMSNPVHFSVSQKRLSPTEIEITFSGSIESGWHVYSTGLPSGGPTAASFTLEKKNGVEPVGKLQAVGHEVSAHDAVFNMTLRYFENSVKFVQRVKLTQPDYEAKGYLEYGACNDQSCMPPGEVDVVLKGSDGPKAAPASAPTTAERPQTPVSPDAMPAPARPDPLSAAQPVAPSSLVTDSAALAPQPAAPTPTYTEADRALWWQPVIKQLQHFDSVGQTAGRSLWMIFLLGLLGGLVALLTPCVWPIIPMTVSFFLHRNDNRRRALRDALIYGASIVIIYVGLGLALTIWRGPDTMNALATNAVVNVCFFLLLVLFGASFLGGFELTLPEKWTNAVNNKSESTGGLLGIFLMALTLTLVSFSCTGPIIGFLLVDTVSSSSLLGPAIGMLGFAIALALPFTLFAMFPTWMKKAPKSGSWMNTVKVVLGFVELAFALKFLSVADLAYGWHLLDRETFLALWIVLFALLGFYLLGRLKLPHDDDDAHTSVPRFFLGLISLAFAVYMVPGLWGAPLRAISAFAPPLSTQDFKLDQREVHAKFTNYEQGMAYARAVGKPVMLDFTGFGCVNCRKMELAVWYDPQVARIINDDYVLISLYVDDKTPLPEPVEVNEGGTPRTLRTVGAKWSYLQSTKFGALMQPFYVLVDNQGRPLTGSYSYKEDIGAYIDFLQKGLEAYRAEP